MMIAIDGPTASGKGTLSKRLAEHFHLPRLDTGALYRAVALALLDAGRDPADPEAAEAAARSLDCAAIDEARIRTAAVGAAASIVAAHPGVRAALLAVQRAFAAQPPGAVLDGRDIGTIVCPHADVKIFVTASLPARAERRWRELLARGEMAQLADVAAQIEVRDARDQGRADAPLAMAVDAHLLDTTEMNADAAFAAALAIIETVLAGD